MGDVFLKLAQALEGFLHSKFLSVLFVSMLPVVEVRGGIPLGLSLNMQPWAAYLSACFAGAIVCPVILIMLKKVINWMCKSKKMGRLGEALNGYFVERAQKVKEGAIVAKRDSQLLLFIALYLFVAVPLPLTGFWTGSAIAVFMNLSTWKSFITITAGNLTSGGLVLLISLVMGDKSWIIFMMFLILLPLVIGLLVFKLAVKRKNGKAANGKAANGEPPHENQNNI